MTNNKGFINPRILGIMLIAASVLLVTTGSQNAMASLYKERTEGSGQVGMHATSFPGAPGTSDVLVEEVVEAEAGNATMTTADNQTATGNMTRTNSTS